MLSIGGGNGTHDASASFFHDFMCNEGHLNTAEAITGDVIILAGMVAMLWFYAGLQTWRLMFLIDPNADTCELNRAMRVGQLPRWLFVGFIIFWPFLLLLVNAADLLAHLQRVSK